MLIKKKSKPIKKKESKPMKVIYSNAKTSEKLTKELKKLNTNKELKIGNQYVAKNKDGSFTVRSPIKGNNTYSHNWNEQTIVNRLNKSDYFEDVRRNLRPKPYALKCTSSKPINSNGNHKKLK